MPVERKLKINKKVKEKIDYLLDKTNAERRGDVMRCAIRLIAEEFLPAVDKQIILVKPNENGHDSTIKLKLLSFDKEEVEANKDSNNKFDITFVLLEEDRARFDKIRDSYSYSEVPSQLFEEVIIRTYIEVVWRLTSGWKFKKGNEYISAFDAKKIGLLPPEKIKLTKEFIHPSWSSFLLFEGDKR